jgi:ribulose-phosphate 3-epimerase
LIIAPSILNADFAKLAEQVQTVQAAGADWLHVDVMDGHFVPNITFGPVIVAGLRKLVTLPLDVHLMIENADAFIPAYREAGADWLTVHVEACPHLWRTLDLIKAQGCKVGVTLNPATPIAVLEPILAKVDLVLVMSVEPGFGGQTFIPEAVGRIAKLAELRAKNGYTYLIEVDGGIDLKTAPHVLAAGVDVLVAGFAIFKQPDIPKAVAGLRACERSSSAVK